MVLSDSYSESNKKMLEELLEKYKPQLDHLRDMADDFGQYLRPTLVMSYEDAQIYSRLVRYKFF